MAAQRLDRFNECFRRGKWEIPAGAPSGKVAPRRLVADEDRNAAGQSLENRMAEILTGGRQEEEIGLRHPPENLRIRGLASPGRADVFRQGRD